MSNYTIDVMPLPSVWRRETDMPYRVAPFIVRAYGSRDHRLARAFLTLAPLRRYVRHLRFAGYRRAGGAS